MKNQKNNKSLPEALKKIGFSKIGGFFVGKNIESDFHRNYAITIIVSLGKPFKLFSEFDHEKEFQAALIQKNIDFSVKTAKDEHVAFVHIVPYSEEGQRLFDPDCPVKKIESSDFGETLALIKDWLHSASNTHESVERIISSIASELGTSQIQLEMDSRILKALMLIMEIKEDKLQVENVAREVCISVSHFNRLFKKETGLTFRRFVLHSKLVKSIYAMYENNTLTEASFIGRFSDQPHLTRTFKENFGIKPSTAVK